MKKEHIFLTNDFLTFEQVNSNNLNKNFTYLGIACNNKKHYFNLNTGVFYSDNQKINIGKEINGCFIEFSNNSKLNKKPIYYCESKPLGIGGEVLPQNIYIGYEIDLMPLQINYSLYKITKAKVIAVYNCEKEEIALTINTVIELNINGNSLVVDL